MTVPAVQKAIAIVEMVARAQGRHSTAELARQLGVAQASCFRIVQTLTEARWIAKNRGGELRLSTGLQPIADSLRGHDWLVKLAEEPLKALVAEVGLPAKLSVREGADQVTLSRAESGRPFALSAPVGSRFPVVLGASGACLLSSLTDRQVNDLVSQAPANAWRIDRPEHLREMLEQVRQNQSCQNIGIHPQGIETVAAPIYSPAGEAIGAITVIGLQGDIDSIGVQRTHALVRQAAKACAQAMGG